MTRVDEQLGGGAAVSHTQGRFDDLAELPTYAELADRPDGPAGTAWGLFGKDDELGTLNFLTPARAKRATSCVVTGQYFSLDLPVDAFGSRLTAARGAPEHHVFAANDFHRDEYLDRYYPQGSSQIDGLRHFGHPDHGFYNGAAAERLWAGDSLLGIDKLADHGIVGRGVLVDVHRYLESIGDPIDCWQARGIPVDVVEAAAEDQGVVFEPGDILILRFGWAHEFLTTSDPRTDGAPVVSVGLAQDVRTIAWLWDHRFSMIAADNIAVEAWPPTIQPELLSAGERSGDSPLISQSGLMHRVLIPLLGMVIGELLDLEALAAACAADGRYDFMLMASPLNLPGGVGSPANAIALR